MKRLLHHRNLTLLTITAFLIGHALVATLRMHVGWIEMGHKDRGEQAGNQSHGSSPLPGDGMERTGPERPMTG